MRRRVFTEFLSACESAFHSQKRQHVSTHQLVNLRDFCCNQPCTGFGEASLPAAPSCRASSLPRQCFSSLATRDPLRRQAELSGRRQAGQVFQSCLVSTKATSVNDRTQSRASGHFQGKSAQQGLYLVALVIGMVGTTYASVPLYRMFCQATGYGGTVQQGSSVEEKLRKRAEEDNPALEAAVAARELTVSFNADVTDGMNWRFWPTQRSVRLTPGQSTLAFYTAHNLSDKSITGVSTYNVSPQQAGAYFNKIQCFCFEEQKLRPGEKIDMPVFFYIDPEFATDPRMKGINHLTLSYTFFKAAEEEDVDEAAYDQNSESAVA